METITETITITTTQTEDGTMAVHLELSSPEVSEGEECTIAYAVGAALIDLFNLGAVEEVFRLRYGVEMKRKEV